MKVPDHIISQIGERLNIAEVVSEYVQLQLKGGRYWGLCPFHTEKTPSFTVNQEKGVFYCFGCQKGGSLFTFIMEMEKMSFMEAVRFLARKAGVELAAVESESAEREAYLELYRRVAHSFHHILLHHDQAAGARSYLMSRQIGQDVLVAFQVGYAPADRDWLCSFLKEKSYSEAFLRRSGLFSEKAGRLYPLFRDRIIFPIQNNRGETVAFGGRALGEGGPKYLNSPETAYFHKGSHLFGPPGVFKSIRERGSFLLVEGYMDVLALSQQGIETCLAPLGTALTPGQVSLLKRYAQQGVLLFDGDEAGLRATEKAISICEQQELSVQVVELPEGKDPAEVSEKEGPEALQKILKCPINSFQFLLQKALERHNVHTPEGKDKIVQYLGPYLSLVMSQVRREAYLRLLAERVGVDYESVRGELLRTGSRERGPAAPVEEQPKLVIGSSDLFVMAAVACNREHFPQVRNLISVEDLEDPRARALFIAMEECFRAEESSLEALLARLEDAGLRDLLLERISSGEFTTNQERLIQDGIRRIKRRALEKRREQVETELVHRAGGGGEPSLVKDLQAEKMYLDEEIESLKVMRNV